MAYTGLANGVKQITTGTVCHLDADAINRALVGWQLDALDFLFIENGGNLVCPASFDLGEDLRLVLTSTTEGDDKPLKYPTIFNTADVAVITKLDLAEAAGCDLDAIRLNIQRVRPGMEVFAISAKANVGVEDLRRFLITRTAHVHATEAV